MIETETTPWRVRPNSLEILAEMKATGDSFDTAKERLQRQFRADAAMLACSPESLDQIENARREADAAVERAASIAEDQRATVAEFEARIASLGSVRLKIASLQSAYAMPDEAALARRALELWFNSDASEFARSSFAAAVNELLQRKLLVSHAERFCEEMAAQADADTAQIRSDASEAGVNLSTLLAHMRAQTSRWSAFLAWENVGAFEGLK